MAAWNQFEKKLLDILPPSFNLIGWSLGGLLATRIALTTPARIIKLMNVTSSPYFIKEGDWPGIEKKNDNRILCSIIKE